MIKFVKLTKWLKPTLILAVTFTALWAYSISAQIEDLEDLKRWSEGDRREELEQLLENAGQLKEFKKFYVPKSQ